MTAIPKHGIHAAFATSDRFLKKRFTTMLTSSAPPHCGITIIRWGSLDSTYMQGLSVCILFVEKKKKHLTCPMVTMKFRFLSRIARSIVTDPCSTQDSQSLPHL